MSSTRSTPSNSPWAPPLRGLGRRGTCGTTYSTTRPISLRYSQRSEHRAGEPSLAAPAAHQRILYDRPGAELLDLRHQIAVCWVQQVDVDEALVNLQNAGRRGWEAELGEHTRRRPLDRRAADKRTYRRHI